MRVDLPAGKYVLAVSGGVDSVVLLDLLAKNPGLELVVAHYDHGIRPDSASDRKFVASLANKYKLFFIYKDGKLGPSASEALAREKRYEFLEKARLAAGVSAIVTAHHQDDLLETAIINLLRGTGRRGLSSLKSTATIKRPLLNYSKTEIKSYAVKNKLSWREDSTNKDDKYLRNYIRHQIIPKLGPAGRTKLLAIIDSAKASNAEIDAILASFVAAPGGKLDRHWFVELPHTVALEVIAAWLRQNGITGYDRKMLERLAAAAKSAKNGTLHNTLGNSFMSVSRNELALVTLER